jgi:hypothetical protein
MSSIGGNNTHFRKVYAPVSQSSITKVAAVTDYRQRGHSNVQMANGLLQAHILRPPRRCVLILRLLTLPVLLQPGRRLHAPVSIRFFLLELLEELHLPNHCSPACNVTAGTPLTAAGAPFGINESCHSMPLRL